MSKSQTAGGFVPAAGQSGVGAPFVGRDAADILLTNGLETLAKDSAPSRSGLLLLADGGRYEGKLFGAAVEAEGELVFTTGMTGYQESLTDPSFAGQVLTFTWPLLGNYGVLPGCSESAGVWPRAVVCRQAMRRGDHRDSIGSVHDLLNAHGVPGIEGVDTRAITRRVREHGTLLCVVGPIEREVELRQRLLEMTPPDAADLVQEVTRTGIVTINGGALDSDGMRLPRLAVIDCGIKYNILRELCRRFEVTWCPATASFAEITATCQPEAFFASNGPGDPAHSGAATQARETLAEAVRSGLPTMGICLGHQLLGLASGLRTYKLLYGHRGANQPVVDKVSGRVSITSQNHGFAVEDPALGMLAPHPTGACSESGTNTLDAEVDVRFVNSNDGTVEGLDVIGKPVFTVQFHPEACPGPHDANPLFDRFSELVAAHLSNPASSTLSPVATPAEVSAMPGAGAGFRFGAMQESVDGISTEDGGVS